MPALSYTGDSGTAAGRRGAISLSFTFMPDDASTCRPTNVQGYPSAESCDNQQRRVSLLRQRLFGSAIWLVRAWLGMRKVDQEGIDIAISAKRWIKCVFCISGREVE
jgi:hypothetical protein